MGLSRIGAGSEPPKSGRKFNQTGQATEADAGMRVADSKSSQGIAAEREPGAAGGQLEFHRELGARAGKWRQGGNGPGPGGCGAIDFAEGCVGYLTPLAAGLLLAALAIK